MSIGHIAALFNPRSALVDTQGIPTSGYGRGLIQALYDRTGSGTGIIPQVSGLLTATGTTIATALQLTDDWNLVGTTPANSGVAISENLDLQPGNSIEVYNLGSNNLNIYPPSSGVQIDAIAAGSPFVLAQNKLRIFQCWTSTLFISFGN